MGGICGKTIFIGVFVFALLLFPFFAKGKGFSLALPDFGLPDLRVTPSLFSASFEDISIKMNTLLKGGQRLLLRAREGVDIMGRSFASLLQPEPSSRTPSVFEVSSPPSVDKPLSSPSPQPVVFREREIIKEAPQVITQREVIREVVEVQKEVVREVEPFGFTSALRNLRSELITFVNDRLYELSSSHITPAPHPGAFSGDERIPGTGYVPDDGDFVYIRRPAKTGSSSSITLINSDGKIPELSTTYFGSVPNIFSSVANASSTVEFSASGVSDTITFAGGGGTTIAFDSSTKKITISSTGGGGSTDSTLLNILDNGSDASSFTGTTKIAGLTINSSGVVTAGTWQGTAIGVGYGGTGLASYTAGDLLYASGATTLSKLAIGAADTVLTSSGTAPQWVSSLTLGGTLTVSGSTTSTFSGPLVTNTRLCISSDCRTSWPSSGISSLNGLTGATQTFADDTNVTISSSGTTHTLGWSGTLAVSRGGTGTGTTFTQGSIVFAGASGVYSQDNSNLFWDDTNNRLGLATTTPQALVHVYHTGSGNALRVDDQINDSSPFVIDSIGRVGIGLTTPEHALDISGGFRIDSGAVQYTTSTGVFSADSMEIGAMSFEDDAGIINWTDMQITSTPAAGTIMSYTAQIDGQPVLTIYGEADGSGGSRNLAVGIATTTPQTRLHIVETASSTNLGLTIQTTNSGAASNQNLLRVISNVGGTGNVKFKVDSDGDIYTDGSTTIGTPADVAEMYPIADSTLEAGDIVSPGMDSVDLKNAKEENASASIGGLVKAEESKALLGVVSSSPGLLLAGLTENALPVALAGRVPVKVSLENGAIAIGDPITLSSVPGVGMKATKAGRIIGYALENLYGPLNEEESKILIFLNIGYIGNDLMLGVDEEAGTLEEARTPLIDKEGKELALTQDGTAVIMRLVVKDFELAKGGTITLPSGHDQVIGKVTLPAGSSGVVVDHPLATPQSEIFLTINGAPLKTGYAITDKKAKQFTISLYEAVDYPLEFTYLIINTYEPVNGETAKDQLSGSHETPSSNSQTSEEEEIKEEEQSEKKKEERQDPIIKEDRENTHATSTQE